MLIHALEIRPGVKRIFAIHCIQFNDLLLSRLKHNNKKAAKSFLTAFCANVLRLKVFCFDSSPLIVLVIILIKDL